MDISVIRTEYNKAVLTIDSVSSHPVEQLERWITEAAKVSCPDHTAMVLSTASTDGQPSNRVVLLKYLTHEGLFFFTNYKSRKGKELLLNPKAAVCFFWPTLERQVRVEGHVVKADADISDFYFKSRPIETQISAIISPQSNEVESRDALIKEWEKVHGSINDNYLERPDYWGGFQLKPSRFEFWQGGEHRLHDRIVYRKHTDSWLIKRLAP